MQSSKSFEISARLNSKTFHCRCSSHGESIINWIYETLQFPPNRCWNASQCTRENIRFGNLKLRELQRLVCDRENSFRFLSELLKCYCIKHSACFGETDISCCFPSRFDGKISCRQFQIVFPSQKCKKQELEKSFALFSTNETKKNTIFFCGLAVCGTKILG